MGAWRSTGRRRVSDGLSRRTYLPSSCRWRQDRMRAFPRGTAAVASAGPGGCKLMRWMAAKGRAP